MKAKNILVVLGAVLLLFLTAFAATNKFASAQAGNVGDTGEQAAAVDYFLEIDGVEGESTDDRHRGEIDIESWSWGETNSGAGASGGGGGAGKVSMQDFHFTKNYDKASPKLFLAVATGEHYKTATLSARKSGGDHQEYLVIKLSDVIITSYQTGGNNGEVPMEQVSMNFAKIEFEYRPQLPDGSLDAPVKAGWDLKANKKI